MTGFPLAPFAALGAKGCVFILDAPRAAIAGGYLPFESGFELLRIVGEQYAVTLPQLARMMDCSAHAARWLRARWERAGWARGREPVRL